MNVFTGRLHLVDCTAHNAIDICYVIIAVAHNAVPRTILQCAFCPSVCLSVRLSHIGTVSQAAELSKGTKQRYAWGEILTNAARLYEKLHLKRLEVGE